jgi:hypothetical protein
MRERELTLKKIFLCISRLERNQEREQGVSNLEYLKNIVLKVPPPPPQKKSPPPPLLVASLYNFSFSVSPHTRSRAVWSNTHCDKTTSTQPTGNKIPPGNGQRSELSCGCYGDVTLSHDMQEMMLSCQELVGRTS